MCFTAPVGFPHSAQLPSIPHCSVSFASGQDAYWRLVFPQILASPYVLCLFPLSFLSLKNSWGTFLGMCWKPPSGAAQYHSHHHPPPQHRPRALSYFSCQSWPSWRLKRIQRLGWVLLMVFALRCPPQVPLLDYQSQFCFTFLWGLIGPSPKEDSWLPSVMLQGVGTQVEPLWGLMIPSWLCASLTKHDVLS